MGSKRIAPKRLAEKLKKIREGLKMTNEELIDKLNCPEFPLYRASITQYEKGQREPPLAVLLRYARLYGVSVETLIDDEMNLPKWELRQKSFPDRHNLSSPAMRDTALEDIWLDNQFFTRRFQVAAM